MGEFESSYLRHSWEWARYWKSRWLLRSQEKADNRNFRLAKVRIWLPKKCQLKPYKNLPFSSIHFTQKNWLKPFYYSRFNKSKELHSTLIFMTENFHITLIIFNIKGKEIQRCNIIIILNDIVTYCHKHFKNALGKMISSVENKNQGIDVAI